MKKTSIAALFSTLLILLGSASALSAQCGLIQVDYNNAITLNSGESGWFTVTVINKGTTTQRISASALCPVELDCSFSGIGSDTLLAASEQKIFSLNVQATTASGSFSIPGEFRAGPSSPTCTAELQFTANVTAQQAQQVQALTAWITPTQNQTARPGDEVEYTIGLKNNLDKKIFASISSTVTNPFETSTSLSASSVSLEPSETKYVNVIVRLPPGTPGGTYKWIYTIDAGKCCGEYSLDLPVEVTVEAPLLSMQLLGSPVQEQCTVVNAGSSVSIPLSIENNGEATGPFDLSIQGSSTVKSITSVSEPRFTLQNGEEQPFQISISPIARTPIDTYTYKLRGTYQGFVFLDRSFCFTVKGVESASISAPSNIVIERARLSNAFMNITNTGTVRDEYALSIDPSEDITVNIQPGTFALNPDEMQTVSLAISTDLTTALGPTELNLRLDALNYSKNIALNSTVYATGRTGESLFKITSVKEVTLAKGAAKQFNVTIENIGQSAALNDVEVTLDGVNPSWYQADLKTILPGESEVFTIVLTVPSEVTQQQIHANLTARSGMEFLIEPITFTISNVVLDFTVKEIIENRNSNGETTSVDLLVTLTNNGLATATQVAPLVSDLNYVYEQIPLTLTLEPGQSAEVKVHLEPAKTDVASQSTSLQFSSTEASSQVKTVTLPTLKIAQTGATGKIALILILLIAIVAVLAKTRQQ